MQFLLLGIEKVNEVDEMKFFYCYSPRLRRFIRENNVRWIGKGINKNSGFPFWRFEDNEELAKILKQYEA